MDIGLVGLPATGKTTIFNLLTGGSAATSASGFTGKSERNVGVAKVADRRVDSLSALYKPEKTTHARIQFIDLPGLSREGSGGKAGGRGGQNQFLAEIRNVDAVVLVARAFANESVPTADGKIDPLGEAQEIVFELSVADLAVVEKRLEVLQKTRNRTKEQDVELAIMERCKAALEDGRLIAGLRLTDEEKALLRSYSFLTLKPLLIAVNLDEDQLRRGDYPSKEALAAFASSIAAPVVEFSGQVEAELGELPPEDRGAFMAEYGLSQSGLDRLAAAAYHHLDLISFFTVGEDEVRAWTITRGTDAKRAAGKIHTDIERGFIKAEVCPYQDLARLGAMSAVKAEGLLRLEGKEYIVKDGDIINFRHSG
ncbi:MAG TPA: redox-regulated ATPase YchF [Bacillota bacterium]